MKEKKYKIRRQDGSKVLMTYDEVCTQLGYRPEVHFVEITTAGTIAVTLGKPHEVLGLAQAITAAGFVQAVSLRQMIRGEFGRR